MAKIPSNSRRKALQNLTPEKGLKEKHVQSQVQNTGFVNTCRRGLTALRELISAPGETLIKKYHKVSAAIKSMRLSFSAWVLGSSPKKLSKTINPSNIRPSEAFPKIEKKLSRSARPIILNLSHSKLWIGLSLICSLTFFGLIGTLFSNKKGHMTSPTLSVINTPPLAAIGDSPAPSKPISEEKPPRDHSFWPKRITVQRVENWPKKRCLERDYTSVEVMFATNYQVGKIFPILDLRGHRFDDNTYAANIGVAGRYVPRPNSLCRIFGMNLYYDFREGQKGHYHQIGLGFETLGKRWDVRANGYIPITSQHKTKCVFDQYIGNFFAIRRDYEFSFYGINAEVGYYFVRGRNFLLYAAGGPYYFTRRSQGFNSLGGEFRIRPQYKDYLAIDLSVRHDSIFGTIYQAKAILYLPLYQLSKNLKKRPCGISDQQIYQPIERFEIIPLRRRTCWKTNF